MPPGQSQPERSESRAGQLLFHLIPCAAPARSRSGGTCSVFGLDRYTVHTRRSLGPRAYGARGGYATGGQPPAARHAAAAAASSASHAGERDRSHGCASASAGECRLAAAAIAYRTVRAAGNPHVHTSTLAGFWLLVRGPLCDSDITYAKDGKTATERFAVPVPRVHVRMLLQFDLSFFLLMPVKSTVRAPAAWPTNWPGLERHVTETFASMLEFVLVESRELVLAQVWLTQSASSGLPFSWATLSCHKSKEWAPPVRC